MDDNKFLQITYCLRWKNINNLFIKQSIMDKTDFLKHVLPNFLKYLLSIFISFACIYISYK